MKTIRLILLFLGMLIIMPQTYGQKGVEDGSRFGHGEDSIRCLENLSLYSELVKQDRYDEAYSYWKVAFNECPLAFLNLYLHGERIMEHKIETASDDSTKEKYYQELMQVYDQRMKYFGDRKKRGTPYIKGKKAIAMLEYKKEESEVQKEAYNLLNESIFDLGAASQPAVLALFMTTTLSMYSSGFLDSEDVVNNYTTITDALNTQLENSQKAEYKEVLENLSAQIEGLFARSGAADCETVQEIYTPQLEENKDDLAWLKRVNRLLARGLCDDSELLYTVSEYQHELEPSSSSAYGLARMNLENGNTERAIEYFKEAINLVENDNQKAEYFYQLAFLQLSQENFAEARSNARKAIEFKPEWGEPHLLIGDAYARSANIIGDNEFEHKTAYWAAVDKFIKAKSVDPEVTEEANKKIDYWMQYFPTKDEIFFRDDYEEGATHTVGGWIGEQTKVRSK
jgi:tetratricopeptide (TPR) repeat protein